MSTVPCHDKHERAIGRSPLALVARASWIRTIGAVVVALAACLAVVAPAHAEDQTIQVTFPEVTRFNPDTTSYTIDITSTGYAVLYLLVDGADYRVIPANGPVTVEFAVDGRQDVVVASAASEAYALATSPILEPRTSLGVASEGYYVTRDGSLAISIPGDVDGDDGGTVAWSLAGRVDSQAVRSGSTRYTQPDGPGTTGFFVIDIDGLPEAEYQLNVELSDNVAPYGTLSSAGSYYYRIDRTAPAVGGPHFSSQGALVDTFYPVGDNYRDDVLIAASVDDDYNNTSFEIRGPNGQIQRLEGCCGRSYGGFQARWNGKIAGELAPEGTYEVVSIADDFAGNVSVSEPSYITVSHKRLRNYRVTVTVPMAATIEKSEVGACSRIVQPSSHGGKGSIGLLAGSKCSDPKRSGIFVQSRIDLPDTFDSHYARPQVGFIGGAAKGTKDAAVIQSVPDTRGREQARRLHAGAWGLHAGPVITKSFALRRDNKTDRLYLLVNTRTVGNSRYDIQALALNIEIRGLR